MGAPDLRPETRAALEALRAVLPLVQERRGASEVRAKGPNDIVTGTDVLVQSTLQQILHEQHPDIAFLGEEGSPDLAPDARRDVVGRPDLRHQQLRGGDPTLCHPRPPPPRPAYPRPPPSFRRP